MSRYSINKNISISAGAGTGKTYTLARRYVNLLLGFEFFKESYSAGEKFRPKKAEKERAMPHEIVTITYTEAAASEMRDRIHGLISGIVRVASGEKTEDESIRDALKHYKDAKDYIHEVLRECRPEMIHARISTIHSFSLGIVRSYSDLVPLDLSPAVAGDDEKKILFNEALGVVMEEQEDVLYTLLDAMGQFRLNGIAEKFVSDARFRRNMRGFTRQRKGSRDIHDIYARFIVTVYYSSFSSAISLLDRLADHAKNPELYNKYREYFMEYIESIIDPEKAVPSNVRIFTVDEEGSGLREEFCNHFSTISKYAYSIDETTEQAFAALLESLELLLEKVYDRYRSALREKNLIDFDIIISEASDLIASGKAAPRYRHFMIDEFQDTNELQWDMFRALMEGGCGSVFLVGDEKQSIYSFQGAEVQVFRKACGDMGSAAIPLTLNFRSEKVILDFVNDCCSSLMLPVPDCIDAGSPGHTGLKNLADRINALRIDNYGTVRYHHLQSQPENEKRKEGSVLWLITPAPEGPEEGEGENAGEDSIEYAAIAAFIEKIKKGELAEYNDITELMEKDEKAVAVLFDSGAGMDMLKDELILCGITPHVKKGDDLYEAKEVQEIYCVLRLIASMNEKTEWKYLSKYHLAGALRGSLIRCDDDEIFRIFEKNDIDTVHGLVRDLLNAKEVMSIHELIAYCISRYNLKTVIRHWDDYEERAANLEKLMGTAIKYEMENNSDLKGFVGEMERFIFFGGSTETAAPYEAPGRGSVELGTIHSSKGLEYPMVIFTHCLKNLKAQQGSEMFKHGTLLAGDEFHTVMGFKVNGESPLPYRAASALSAHQHMEEKKRLLYVALTRARRHLVLSVPPLGESIKDNCYLHYLTRQYRDDFTGIVQDITGGARNRPIKHRSVRNARFMVADIQRPADEKSARKALPVRELPAAMRFSGHEDNLSVTGQLDVGSWMLSDGDSSELGTAFHELAAHCFDDLEDRAKTTRHIKNICGKYMLGEDASDKLESFAVNLAASPIYREILDAEERYPEFGYTRKNDTGGVVTGTIDLVYRTKGKLKIVDYKTNSRKGSTPEKEVKKHRYDIQLEEYAKAVEEALGEKVGERIVVFVDGGKVAKV